MKTIFGVFIAYLVLMTVSLACTLLVTGVCALFNGLNESGDPAWLWWALPRFIVSLLLVPVFLLAWEDIKGIPFPED